MTIPPKVRINSLCQAFELMGAKIQRGFNQTFVKKPKQAYSLRVACSMETAKHPDFATFLQTMFAFKRRSAFLRAFAWSEIGFDAVRAGYLTLSNSTSKTSVAFGGISGGMPAA